jgi:hypothetical protein
VVRGGLQLMVVDLAIQMSITITVYVAAVERFENAYKLAAATSAYWTFGPSYMITTFLLLKVHDATWLFPLFSCLLIM